MNEETEEIIQNSAEDLSEAVSHLIEKAISGVDSATGFLSDEIPLSVHELMLWHGVFSFLSFFGCMALSISLVFSWKPMMSFVREKWSSSDGCIIFVPILFYPLVSVLTIKLFSITWLKILVAPRVFLVDYAAKML